MVEDVEREVGGLLPLLSPVEPAAALVARPGREPALARDVEERAGARRPGGLLAAAERLVEGLARTPRVFAAAGWGLVEETLAEGAGLAACSELAATAASELWAAAGSGFTSAGLSLAAGGSLGSVGCGCSGVVNAGGAGSWPLTGSVADVAGTSWLATVIVVELAGWDRAEARVRERRGAVAMESDAGRVRAW